MFSVTTKGIYICRLKGSSGDQSHVVGIDCDTKRIYDGMEDYSYKLTKESIAHCARPNNL